ncbi:MAG: hypothetical protein FWF06_06565, partial [Symbiobacteriaceae bacterium]|nr:hypothetical protein [Symbiobacteriaceae bacterium]
QGPFENITFNEPPPTTILTEDPPPLIVISDPGIPTGGFNPGEEEPQREETPEDNDDLVVITDPPTPLNKMPYTGVESNQSLWIFTLGAALAGSLLAVLGLRKEKQTEASK